MSASPVCFQNIIGISRTPCPCVEDLTVEATTSASGLYLDELDEITLLAYRLWDGDAHSESWLSSSELAELMVWWDAHKDQHGISDPFGYVFGNEIDSIVKYPKDFERLRGLGLEDVRAVFWFDN